MTPPPTTTTTTHRVHNVRDQRVAWGWGPTWPGGCWLASLGVDYLPAPRGSTFFSPRNPLVWMRLMHAVGFAARNAREMSALKSGQNRGGAPPRWGGGAGGPGFFGGVVSNSVNFAESFS